MASPIQSYPIQQPPYYGTIEHLMPHYPVERMSLSSLKAEAEPGMMMAMSTNQQHHRILPPPPSAYKSPFQLLSRSSPNSPIGSNVSIVGSLISHGSNERKSNSGGNGGGSTNWKLRAKYYSKRRGQERSIDRERQPSICSDSETDSINGQQKIGNPNS